jgi:hypothetical protein
MTELFAKIQQSEGTFDIIFDPKIGKMELQEMGIDNLLDYNLRDRFAFVQDMDGTKTQNFIKLTAENLGIQSDDTELVDKLTEKITKVNIEFETLDEGGFWITFWYNDGVGNIHRQGKAELLIKPHSKLPPQKYDFVDYKKKVWIQKIAADCKAEFQEEIEIDQFNDYIKKNDLLWLLEDMIEMGYDIWDLMEEVNEKITG